jgi:hypothetical protein
VNSVLCRRTVVVDLPFCETNTSADVHSVAVGMVCYNSAEPVPDDR